MKASRLGDMFVYAAAALCLLPLVVMVGASLFYDGGLSGEQYGRALLQTTEFFQGFWRSFLYTAGILAISIPVSLLTAYGFTRRHFRGRQVALWLYIVLMLMPFQALIVPQYLALKTLGLLGSPWAVVLPNAFSTLGTVLMVQYMRSLDGALFEAGKIDGAGEWQLFLRLAAPLCRPVAYALLVLCFVNYWSMVEQPIVFLKDLADMPLSVRLNMAAGQFEGIAPACGVLFTVLPMLLYVYCYEDLLSGIGLHGAVEVTVSEHRKRRSVGRLMAGFLAFLLLCTLATQKITYMMTTEVNIATPSGQSIGEDYYSLTVPIEAVQMGQVFVLSSTPADSTGERYKVSGTQVRVLAEDDRYAAVEGPLAAYMTIVSRSPKALADGVLIRVVSGEPGLGDPAVTRRSAILFGLALTGFVLICLLLAFDFRRARRFVRQKLEGQYWTQLLRGSGRSLVLYGVRWLAGLAACVVLLHFIVGVQFDVPQRYLPSEYILDFSELGPG